MNDLDPTPARTRPASRTVASADGTTLHVRVAGDGTPGVVLAHGFGGSSRNFLGVQRALAARHRVVLYDARGHARSGAPEDPARYGRDILADDLAAVIAATGLAQPVVGGLSMGAATALAYATSRPREARGLLLAAPFVPTAAEQRARRAWADRFATAIEAQGLAAAGAEHAWGAGSGFDAAARRFIEQGFLEHPAHAVAALLRRVIAEQPGLDEVVASLAGFDRPILVVVGTDDRLCLGGARALAAALPTATLVEIEGAGHVVNLSAPDAFLEAVTPFLARLS